MSRVYIDHKDKSVIRIDTDNILKILSDHNILVSTKLFPEVLEDFLNQKLVGKARADQFTRFAIADAVYKLAINMRVTEQQIQKFLEKHYQDDDLQKLPQQIKDWRKQYYGSMSAKEKEDLIQSIKDTVRPEILDEIRKA